MLLGKRRGKRGVTVEQDPEDPNLHDWIIKSAEGKYTASYAGVTRADAEMGLAELVANPDVPDDLTLEQVHG